MALKLSRGMGFSSLISNPAEQFLASSDFLVVDTGFAIPIDGKILFVCSSLELMTHVEKTLANKRQVTQSQLCSQIEASKKR